MNDNERYIEQLEKLIVNELLPIYDLYYSTLNLPKPELSIPFNRKRKIAAILRADL